MVAVGLYNMDRHRHCRQPQVKLFQHTHGVVHALSVALHIDDNAGTILVVPDMQRLGLVIVVREVRPAIHKGVNDPRMEHPLYP